MSVPLARASLFDPASENDFTLLEDEGRYYVQAANRTGTYEEFIRALFGNGELICNLTNGNVQAKFLVLMESLAQRWGDKCRAEIVE